ncbi:MAG TPA: helix-turn-helix domain-containing protein [Nocardioidaceae bacterium]|nr:helix-turn-helix domain-containing protein [Nocardioidaceae bacterium]
MELVRERAQGDRTRVLSTADVTPGDRVDAWHELVRSVCGPVDVATGTESFDGTIVQSSLGDVQVCLITADEHSVSRSRRRVRLQDDTHIYVSTPLRGRLTVAQDEERIAVEPGDVVTFDSTRPYTLALPGGGRLVSVRLSHDLLGLNPRGTRTLTARPWPGDTGIGALASTVLKALGHRLAELDDPERNHLANVVVELVTSLFAQRLHTLTDKSDSARQGMLLRIQSFARNNLADTTLTPSVLARSHNVSLRYLQLLFAEQGTSPARWLREQRLARCRADLSDASLDHLTVAAIGARWGIGQASQVSRLFRQTFGVSPSVYRRTNRGHCAIA